MTKQEFETLTGQQLNDEDYGIVEKVYAFYPGHPRRGRKEGRRPTLPAIRPDHIPGHVRAGQQDIGDRERHPGTEASIGVRDESASSLDTGVGEAFQ